MKIKRKFLHIELMDGQLYVYAADEQFGAKEITLNQIDEECRMDYRHVVIRPEELLFMPKLKKPKKKIKNESKQR